MSTFYCQNWIIAFSFVSSYEASAARSLMQLGADVAIVIMKNKDETRISFRTTSEFIQKTTISLAKDIIPIFISNFGGNGGGHDGACGYNSSKLLDIKEVKFFLKELFENIIDTDK